MVLSSGMPSAHADEACTVAHGARAGLLGGVDSLPLSKVEKPPLAAVGGLGGQILALGATRLQQSPKRIDERTRIAVELRAGCLQHPPPGAHKRVFPALVPFPRRPGGMEAVAVHLDRDALIWIGHVHFANPLVTVAYIQMNLRRRQSTRAKKPQQLVFELPVGLLAAPVPGGEQLAQDPRSAPRGTRPPKHTLETAQVRQAPAKSIVERLLEGLARHGAGKVDQRAGDARGGDASCRNGIQRVGKASSMGDYI